MKKRTYIYRSFERFWHWTQSLLIIFLAITGFEIHSSYSLLGFERAVMLHDIFAWSYMVLIVFTIFWHFDSGTWKQYIPTLKLVKAQFEYYISGIFRGAEHPTKKTSYNKFNPIQRLTYLAFKILIIPVMVGTGIVYMYFMYPDNHLGVDKLEIIALIHTFGAFLLIVFLIAHLYLLSTNHDPMESIVAMISGWEEVDIEPEEEHRLHMQYAVDKSIAGYYRLDAEGNFIDVNKAWLDLYKCEDKNKAVGKHYSNSRSDQNIKKLKELVDRAMKGESIRGIPSVRKCFDGSEGKHILSINPTYENDEIIGVEGFVIDISDISSVNDEMYHSIRNNNSGYYKVNKDGYFEDVNDVWLKIYKYDNKEQVIGKHYSLIRERRDLQKLTEKFKEILKGETVKTQLVNRKCVDGTIGNHILSVSPYYEGTEIAGMEGFILDVTDLDLDKKDYI
jgi:PAS domain S-box-containing protein